MPKTSHFHFFILGIKSSGFEFLHLSVANSHLSKKLQPFIFCSSPGGVPGIASGNPGKESFGIELSNP